jgi:molybdopterin converting factor small subunit
LIVTVRLRGEFREAAGAEFIIMDFDALSVSGDGIRRRLDSLLGSTTARDTLEHAALFRDGRLLRPEDLVRDGDVVHVLSPFAGG